MTKLDVLIPHVNKIWRKTNVVGRFVKIYLKLNTYISRDDERSIRFRLINSCFPYSPFFAVEWQLGAPIALASHDMTSLHLVRGLPFFWYSFVEKHFLPGTISSILCTCPVHCIASSSKFSKNAWMLIQFVHFLVVPIRKKYEGSIFRKQLIVPHLGFPR